MIYEDETTKEDLLSHYATREPTHFKQFDCFCHVEPGDSIIVPDADGDSLFRLDTAELMYGSTVRVFVKPNESASDVVRALTKISAFIKKHGDECLTGKYPGWFVRLDPPYDEGC
jgi:hypothetical protein